MQPHRTLTLCLLLAVLLGCGAASAEFHVEYVIQIDTDGSAAWTIEERFLTGENPPPSLQLFDTFISNMTTLAEAAKLQTGREMTLGEFGMTANVSGSYTVVTYRLRWTEFAVAENDSLRIGDVFAVNGLFLFGEGAVTVLYPSGYRVTNVSPQPHAQSPLTLVWWGVGDFNVGEPNVTFTKREPSPWDPITNNALTIAGVIAVAALSSAGLYLLKFRRAAAAKERLSEARAISDGTGIESDADRIVGVLKAANGSLHQAAIATRCGFSKAKTSLLLKEMEEKGIVRRREWGRQKLVTLAERTGEGETQT
jgi:uncharacterized membrane protein